MLSMINDIEKLDIVDINKIENPTSGQISNYLIQTNKNSGYIKILDKTIYFYKLSKNSMLLTYDNLTHILNYTNLKGLRNHIVNIKNGIELNK